MVDGVVHRPIVNPTLIPRKNAKNTIRKNEKNPALIPSSKIIAADGAYPGAQGRDPRNPAKPLGQIFIYLFIRTAMTRKTTRMTTTTLTATTTRIARTMTATRTTTTTPLIATTTRTARTRTRRRRRTTTTKGPI